MERRDNTSNGRGPDREGHSVDQDNHQTERANTERGSSAGELAGQQTVDGDDDKFEDAMMDVSQGTGIDGLNFGSDDVQFFHILEGLKVTWKVLENAESYEIYATRKGIEGMEETIHKNTHSPEYVFKTSVYGFKTGEIIKVVVAAIDNQKKSSTACDEVEYVIGGDSVPSNVKLSIASSSHNSLQLAWRKAKRDPSEYEVTVFEMENDRTEEVDKFIVVNSSATLNNLNHLTKYYCEVVAKFSQAEYGSPVTSNILETTDLPPETFKAGNVHAKKDPGNPSRQIIVKWQAPATNLKKLVIARYDVHLLFGGNMKTEIQNIKGKYECCFQNLKSQTSYMACVVTVKELRKIWRSKSKESFSEVVTTDPAQKTPGFDIYVKGQPIIKMCEPRCKASGVTGILEWELPDLGIEKNNFKLLGVVASVESASEQKMDFEMEKQVKHKSIPLKPGKKYSMTVECKYIDFDTDEEIKVAASKKLSTDIGKPSIDNITWKGKEITISWKNSKGAVKHVLSIFDDSGRKLHTSDPLQQQTVIVEMTDSYSYGKTCEFVIEATGINDKTEKSRKIKLIGGDVVTTDVTAKGERRQVIVIWKAPKQTPKGYKLLLYEMSGPNLSEADKCEEVTAIEQTQTSHRFIELKSQTYYCCHVYPIYHRGAGNATVSNVVQTPPRMEFPQEKNINFGKLENVNHDVTAIVNDAPTIKLSWSKAQLGENYKVSGYRVDVTQKGRFYNSSVMTKLLKPTDTNLEAKDLATGYEYGVKVHTIYQDLDSDKQREKTTEYSFTTTPSRTNINDCTWSQGVIFFTWTPVCGARSYRLTIKDELLSEFLVPDITNEVPKDGEGCQAHVQMSEKLGIGRICMTKITAYAANKMTSETDWKPHLIGGKNVVKNVKATRNVECPSRSLNITFDSPMNGVAKEYKVVAIPEAGKKKTQYTQSSPFVFEYLQKGVSYTFEVYAKKGETWSTPSVSNKIVTEGQKSAKFFDIKHVAQLTVELSRATLRDESTVINVVKDDDFGKVRDLDHTLKNGPNSDLINLHWILPGFGNNSSDYKVEKFKVEIRKPNSTKGTNYFVNFDKTKLVYSTEEYELELGESYDVSVSTIYEDIDKDVSIMSSGVKLRINTRPCKPNIFRNEYKNDTLTIEWSKVNGAKRYEVELHTENVSSPYVKETTETKFTKKFDETFGYGKTYYGVIKAFGDENKSNQSNTNSQTIGGEFVPRKVLATIDHSEVKDANSQVHLSWIASQEKAERFEVASSPAADGMHVSFLKDESCLVSGLKAGTHYSFKVMAIHKKDNEEIKSGGSISNKVQTNPTPTQVKNVNSQPGDNPSTSVTVYWEKVDAEKKNETTKYKVCVVREDGSAKRKVTIHEENVTLHGLEPGVSYVVTVAGGNSIGFDRQSEKATFKTELGTPKNVTLTNHADNPSTCLVLAFSETEGNCLRYVCTLYKYHNQVRQPVFDSIIVESGKIFPDLEPSTQYQVEVHAVTNAVSGKHVTSDKAVTAPSKPIITEYGCSKQDKVLSCRKIFAKWKSDQGCDYHEVSILRGKTQFLESQLFVRDKNEIVYSCQHESTQYLIEVRSKNSSGHTGKASNRQIIHLAPAKLEGVHAELNSEDCGIKVQCLKAQRSTPFYFMVAYCGDRLVTEEPLKKESQDESKSIEWIYMPEHSAQKYTFELWAEDSRKVKGKSTRTWPVTSRPCKEKILSLEVLKSLPSTDIKICWEGQERCKVYEVSTRIKNQENFESLSRCSQTICTHRCRSPGNTYLVSVRAFCGSVWGYWSDEQPITLAPAEIQLIEDHAAANVPVSSVIVRWKPLNVKPEGYLVKLFCDNKESNKTKTQTEEHVFDSSFTPGSQCYCTVAAYNGENVGKPTKSRNYKIEWTKPENISIFLDENEPSRKAEMEWDHPIGVTEFKLEIENNQTGVVTPSVLSTARYVFYSGVPGNTYTVKLYCGCDGRYDINFLQGKVTMSPAPPTDLKVVANQEVNGLAIEFKDSVSARKSYKLCIEPLKTPQNRILEETKQHTFIVRDLVPGEAYKVLVNTVIDKTISNALSSDGYTLTFPDAVKNLRSRFENGSVVFEWDPLDITPTEYIVQWYVDNQPISEQRTRMESFSICRVKPAHWYQASVMAFNRSGCGPMSHWETFISDPLPPTAITVRKNEDSPTTSLIAKFQDERDPLKSYRVAALVGGKEVKVVTTEDHYAVLTNLEPGQPYNINVQTEFCGKLSQVATHSRYSF